MLPRTFLLLFALLAAQMVSAYAGPLDDSLLAGAAARLDVKGVEIALRRGAKPAQNLSHPEVPTVKKTPIQFALFALIQIEEPDKAIRAERILQALFKAGATLTGEKEELYPAVSGGHERIVELLLVQGANPHSRIYGYSTAELAIKYEQTKLLPLFYARGVPKVDTETRTQIEFVRAASRQSLGEMQLALTRGAKVNDADPAGSVAIVQLFSMPLIEPDGYDSFKWLLFEAGADANATEHSDEKSTALNNLIRRNSYKSTDHFTTAGITEILLRNGANVSGGDSLGRTPLHYAAQRGNVIAMQVLIKSGAKVMTRDVFKKTPLDLATSGEAIALLRAAGARE